jgi:hypothetical protein
LPCVLSRHAGVGGQLSVVLCLLAGPFARDAQPATEGAKEPFTQGQQALAKGDLVQAEAVFRRVLAIHENDAGARANLGVIAMRRKQWKDALNELQSACSPRKNLRLMLSESGSTSVWCISGKTTSAMPSCLLSRWSAMTPLQGRLVTPGDVLLLRRRVRRCCFGPPASLAK